MAKKKTTKETYSDADTGFVKELRKLVKLRVQRIECQGNESFPGEPIQATINKMRLVIHQAKNDNPDYRYCVLYTRERDHIYDMHEHHVVVDEAGNGLGWFVALAAANEISDGFLKKVMEFDENEKLEEFLNTVVPA